MLNILKQLISRHWLFVMISGFLLAAFEYLVCAMVSTVDIAGAFAELTKTFPLFLRTLIEQQFFGVMSNAGILAFGWNHPITLALGTAVPIVLAARSVAGEIENGAMELVVSQPVSRFAYLFGHVLFAIISMVLISVLTTVGTLVGQYIHKFEAFSLSPLFRIALNFFLLNLSWYGISMIISVFSREAGRVATIGFLLALVSYFINVIGGLWDQAAFMLPYSLHTYYSPKDVLAGNIAVIPDLIILGILTFITISTACLKFLKRDLP